MSTRSGTGQYHGSLFESLQNDVLNARNFFAATRPPIRLNQYGASFGGPLTLPKLYHGRDKTFFFFNFEQYKTFTFVSGTPLETVPTAAFRQGDFSGALTGRNLGTSPAGTGTTI